MYYTEWLRVRNLLKWYAIVLGAFCLIHGAVLALYPALVNIGTEQVPLPALFALSGLIAAFCSSRCGRALSEENEGHLPVTFTRPISRTGYALNVVAIDAAGIAIAFLMVFAADLIVTAQHRALGSIVVTPDSAAQLARFIALPFAYYGVMMALTAWTGKAGRGLVGWGWAASFVLLLLASIPIEPPWNSIFSFLNVINPLAYASYSYHVQSGSVDIIGGSPYSLFTGFAALGDFLALASIAVAGVAAGIAEWRRVEA